MKRIIITLCLAIGLIQSAMSDPVDYLKDEIKGARYGLHLVSMHVPETGTNNGNLGIYIRTKSGWLMGHYHNSVWTYSNYYGWETPEFLRVSIGMVMVSGYTKLSGLNWTPAVLPNVRLYTWDNPSSGIKAASVRLSMVPDLDNKRIGLWHLSADVRF